MSVGQLLTVLAKTWEADFCKTEGDARYSAPSRVLCGWVVRRAWLGLHVTRLGMRNEMSEETL